MTADDERELRELLERTVPRLPAPALRMRRLRERVVRRRRRRTAAAAGSCVAAAAVLAGTLLPDPPKDTGPALVPPAASASRDLLRHSELAGLTVELPRGWYGLAVPEDRGNKMRAVAYAAPQPLGGGGSACARDGIGVCPPLDRLPESGGALLILTLDRTPTLAGKAQSPPRLDGTSLDGVCRSIGASRQYYGLAKVPGQPDAALAATLCASGGSAAAGEQAEVMRRMLAGVRFAKYASRPPTSATKAPADR
ncbi:hypothetical protein H9Y04_17520 [Streptomyces sp. TRM66268-LWL]|uniref:Tat pathway signal sequence domain protein n=1 Tax=Streptomyces polyasparticus TaxID=2767826 RepID=A0ABR7SFU5_9ACTN|nr:hypothetical protein [Streptomyces polyasparticus]MBC9714361.1 hypothetical protein [Streptomyces polyasparticus]